MKTIKKIAAILIILVVLGSCSNMRWATNAGVNVNFGPNGPRVNPHFDVDLYSGGRF